MKSIVTFLILMTTIISSSQENDKFLSEFMMEEELNDENKIEDFKKYDFSKIITFTKTSSVLGIIGINHQRIKIKFLELKKEDDKTYKVSGVSLVKGNKCSFKGSISIDKVLTLKQKHWGVDRMYENTEITDQGVCIMNYELKENPTEKYTGTFKGKLYVKWYVKKDKIYYDDIQKSSDSYINNAFVGYWKSYTNQKKKICNWADYRVPKANKDFDIGAGEFSPSEKYLKFGWTNYQQAWLYQNKLAKIEEQKHWWR